MFIFGGSAAIKLTERPRPAMFFREAVVLPSPHVHSSSLSSASRSGDWAQLQLLTKNVQEPLSNPRAFLARTDFDQAGNANAEVYSSARLVALVEARSLEVTSMRSGVKSSIQ